MRNSNNDYTKLVKNITLFKKRSISVVSLSVILIYSQIKAGNLQFIRCVTHLRMVDTFLYCAFTDNT